MTIKIASLSTINDSAQRFISNMGNNTVFAFYGEMGAGKTTFIKALCKALGVEDVVNSPTFSIVNEYDTPSGKRVFHFDFYRINSPREALDFGVEEYFYSNNLCFIEWPEKVDSLLPPGHIKVQITECSDGTRNVEF